MNFENYRRINVLHLLVFGVTDAKNEEKKTEVSCKMEINREK